MSRLTRWFWEYLEELLVHVLLHTQPYHGDHKKESGK